MIATLLGGIGLFLLGMVLLTEGLKAVAGDALRRWLARAVRGRVSAIASGAVTTALVQSSSATTVATIGFVGAGLFTFPQAVGVIVGANIGTTSTGWIVAGLGLQFTLSTVAMPLVGVGALMRVLAKDRWATAGMALAGFGMIFVGIDTLQVGMGHLADRVTPGSLPGSGIVGAVLMVALGFAMTVVLQSSSAAVTATLAAVYSGAIGLEQAAAMVIGQNVGTTMTALLAAIGGSTAARRTALAHVLFNVTVGVGAFALLPAFAAVASRVPHPETAAPMLIAGFHTAFNVLGGLAFLPWLGRFAHLIERLVPERGPRFTQGLDRSTRAMPSVAIEAVRHTLAGVAEAVQRIARNVVLPERGANGVPPDVLTRALDDTRTFLGSVRGEGESADEHQRHLNALHALDHLDRLWHACRHAPKTGAFTADPVVEAAAREIMAALDAWSPWLEAPDGPRPTLDLADVSTKQAERRRMHRTGVLDATAAGRINPADAAVALDAMRWLDRVAYHAWRTIHHLHP
ncbi:MAG: Na/Pi symporter [Gemmatimonadales bacterium]